MGAGCRHVDVEAQRVGRLEVRCRRRDVELWSAGGVQAQL